MSYRRTSDERFDAVEQVDMMLSSGSSLREACEWADLSTSSYRRWKAEIVADSAAANAEAEAAQAAFIAASEARHAPKHFRATDEGTTTRTVRVDRMQCDRMMTPQRAATLANHVLRDRAPVGENNAVAVSRLATMASGSYRTDFAATMLPTAIPGFNAIVWC